MNEKEKTPEDIAIEQRDDQRFADDPAKEYRLTINGMPIIKDEYFDLNNFKPAQDQLDKIRKERL